MNLVWQALRAATVDTFGVVCAVWLILGLPLMGYQAVQKGLAAKPAMSSSWQDSASALQGSAALKGARAVSAVSAGTSMGKLTETSVAHGLMPHAAVWVVSPTGWIR
jgi:hypothetical protein